MYLTILGIGSRGDVQPLIPLALRLTAAGHQVRLATHRNFEVLVRSWNLNFYPISGDAAAFYSGAAGVAFRDRMRGDPERYKRFVENYLGAYMERLLTECWEASQGADVILSWPWTRMGPSFAEKLGIRCILMSLSPVTYLPTSAFANPYQGVYQPGQSGAYNFESWAQAKPLFAVGQELFHTWRHRFGLPRLEADAEQDHYRALPHLFCWSRHVLPKPHEWPDHMSITGFWFLDHEPGFEPPDELRCFLEAGDPPVVLGFGSQVQTSGGLSAQALTEMVVRAVEASGQRAIFVSGFGGLRGTGLSQSVLTINNVLYSWLLPRSAALIHHGGAGSMADGLRVGLPGMGIPFGYDQPLWAHRIHELGLGPAPIPAGELTAERLAASIVDLLQNAAYRRNAASIAAKLREEDGVGCAVELITGAVRAALV